MTLDEAKRLVDLLDELIQARVLPDPMLATKVIKPKLVAALVEATYVDDGGFGLA